MFEEIYEKDYLDFYDTEKCIGDLGEKWCNFKWFIKDLQLYPHETIKSPLFTTRLLPKTYWYLQVQLKWPGDVGAINISLRRVNNKANVDSTVDVIYKVTCSEETLISDKNTIVFNKKTPQNKLYYCASFINVKMGDVTIECKLRPNKIMIQNVCHSNLDENLPVDFRRLLQSGELYDTIIHVGDKQLMVHYAIVRARLPGLLPPYSPNKDEKMNFYIQGLSVSVVKEMLKYAYTGKACLDSKSASKYRDILVENNNFFHSCWWEDHPSATTSFNYETDSLEWKLEKLFKKEEIGRKKIHLLKIYPNELELFLDFIEWKKYEKILTLSFKFSNEKMPKPTIVSCKYSLLNEEKTKILELGQTETLLSSMEFQAKMKLCSYKKYMNGMLFLNTHGDYLILKTDFKFCYGSSKSSIENIYEGEFDISQCTSCALLSADMHSLYKSNEYWDVELISNNVCRFFLHKAILIARWGEADGLKVKENSVIVYENDDNLFLRDFLRMLYTGNPSP